MTPVVRKMVVIRAPGTNDKPAIRIVNKWLVEAGFVIGTQIEVSYQPDIITIKKLNHENRLLPKALSITDTDGGAEDGH